MIKRYGLGAKPEKLTSESVQFGLMGIVERPDGEYYKASDVDDYLESIGAGGVSGRITKKTLEQHRAEFQDWYTALRKLPKDADLTQYDECFYLWQAWKAARGVSE